MTANRASSTEIDRQLPVGGEIFLDHVGHFVRDAEAASRALARAGFAPTPQSVQSNPDGTPTGTGNVTAMFSRGYIEVLFKTADTPLGREFDLALAGHAGVHLAAFSIADAEGQHRRLTDAGFAMRPLVQFQRPVETVTGPDVAAFTVVRLERGAMAEGRIQMLAHRTENTVWQPRWLTHRNGALGLVDLVVVVRRCGGSGRPLRALHRARGASRRNTDRPSRSTAARCNLFSSDAFAAMFPEIAMPQPAVHGRLCGAGAIARRGRGAAATGGHGDAPLGAALVVPFPDELGVGAWLFVENAADLPWRS